LEFFKKHQKMIIRGLGAFLLIVGFVIHFWAKPQKAVSANAIAAANLARMQASVKRGTAAVSKKPATLHISKALKETREKQLRYMTIFFMIVGTLFLLYSFLKKEES
jgi:multisubunit Na+/H+ antiporter MnhG subunit